MRENDGKKVVDEQVPKGQREARRGRAASERGMNYADSADRVDSRPIEQRIEKRGQENERNGDGGHDGRKQKAARDRQHDRGDKSGFPTMPMALCAKVVATELE